MVFLIQQTMLYAVPLMIVALAGIFAERSGVINLALEGIMIFGAFMGSTLCKSNAGRPGICSRTGADIDAAGADCSFGMRSIVLLAAIIFSYQFES